MPRKLDRKAFVIASLRRASYRWPPREEARRKAKVGRNAYVCAECIRQNAYSEHFSRKDTKLDHIIPVVPVTGFDSLEGFVERLYCMSEGFQVLCKKHHDDKTREENLLRKINRNLKKQLQSKPN